MSIAITETRRQLHIHMSLAQHIFPGLARVSTPEEAHAEVGAHVLARSRRNPNYVPGGDADFHVLVLTFHAITGLTMRYAPRAVEELDAAKTAWGKVVSLSALGQSHWDWVYEDLDNRTTT